MHFYYESPIGRIFLAASELGLQTLIFVDGEEETLHKKLFTGMSSQAEFSKGMSSQSNFQDKIAPLVIDQLDEYFSGNGKSFDIPLDLQGTEFQKRVWAELLKIPFGKTISYKELAIRLGDVKCIRAAGTANGANPVSIIVPCHRVIGSDGSLIGYGGGLWRKRWLLDFERKDTLF